MQAMQAGGVGLPPGFMPAGQIARAFGLPPPMPGVVPGVAQPKANMPTHVRNTWLQNVGANGALNQVGLGAGPVEEFGTFDAAGAPDGACLIEGTEVVVGAGKGAFCEVELLGASLPAKALELAPHFPPGQKGHNHPTAHI